MSSKKGKVSKPAERKDSKKADDSSSTTEPKEEPPVVETRPTSAVTEIVPPETPCPVPEAPKEQPIDDSVLTKLIVQRAACPVSEKTGRYIGTGDVEFTGGHYYKGQFQNGMMHGRGFYRWADGTTYEGDFVRNEIKGRGIYKWPEGSLYEGEVCAGIRHGFGTFRFENNCKSYQGDWYKGKKHGRGRMDYDPEGISYYEGDWNMNVRHGVGTRRYPSGNMYTGMWYCNQRHGEGNMRWLDRDQMYDGQWEDGLPHGYGQHIWFLKRVAGSQYPTRNMYVGEFVKGFRQGYGMFYYANGARYEGEWFQNLKHGKGKFIFKNGRIYEGVFNKDHIVEYPGLNFDPLATPDPNVIKTRTPLPSDQVSSNSNDSHNTYSPSFQLEVDHIIENFDLDVRQEERIQVMHVAMRYISGLRKMYSFYSSLGFDESPDNTFTMTRIQLWRLLKDCGLHVDGTTVWEMDGWISYNRQSEDLHNPFDKILFREFMNYLIVLSYHLYSEDTPCNEHVLAWCFAHLMNTKVLRNACAVQGYIYRELRRAVNALVHADGAYDVFQSLLQPHKKEPYDYCMTMRQFLLIVKDLGLINENLTAQSVVEILAFDDPNVKDEDGLINLQLKMTYLEFLEALVGCAQEYVTEDVVNDPSTPRPSSTPTLARSLASGPVSRLPSHLGGGETPIKDVEERSGSPRSVASAQAASLSTAMHKQTTASSMSSQQGKEVSSPLTERKSLPLTGGSASGVSSRNSDMDPVSTIGKDITSRPPSEAACDDRMPSEAADYDFLDESTRLFNFWTHQVHIFFVRKFFPAANKYLFLRQAVKEKYPDPDPPTESSSGVTSPVDDDRLSQEMSNPTVLIQVTS